MTRKADIKQVDSVAAQLRLSKEQRKLLHMAVSKQGLTYQEILEAAREVKQDYPRKRG